MTATDINPLNVYVGVLKVRILFKAKRPSDKMKMGLCRKPAQQRESRKSNF